MSESVAPQDDPTRSRLEDVTATLGPADRAALPEPAGAAFGRYRLLARLGEGGMGVVWKAEDTQLGRIVALKRIKGECAERGVNLERFVREAKLAARLHHPGIVAVHDSGEVDGECFITMEYIEGRTFAEYLRETQPAKDRRSGEGMVRLREEIRHLSEVAEAVGHAHQQGIIHRDLKPGNIILDRSDRPRVMDFGLAKEVTVEEGKGFRDVRDALTVQGVMTGTPAYMSPEQAQAQAAKIGPVSDVWALGVILYEILTGRRPFAGPSLVETLAAVLTAEPIPPRSRHPQVPVELEAVCLRALEKNTDRRYPNAGVLADELRSWLCGEPVAARPLGRPARAWRSVKRNRTAMLSLLATVALLVALGWGWVGRRAAAERMKRVLGEIGASVDELQTTLMTIEMPLAAKGALARQPLQVLNALLAEDPALGPAWSWRGRVHSMIGRPGDAEADFDRGCSLSPESAVVWYLRGMEAIRRYAESRGLPSARFGADGVRFLPMAPESEAEAGWRTRGLADLERMAAAAEKDPSFGHTESALGRATAALHRGGAGACEAALELLEGVERPEAWRIQAFCHYALGRFEEAVAAGTRAVEAWPADLRSWHRRGYAHFALGLTRSIRGEDGREDLRRSAADLGRAIQQQEGLAVAYGFRGLTFFYLADMELHRGVDPRASYRLAIQDLEAGLKLDPDSEDLGNTLANAESGLAVAESKQGGDAREWYARAAATREKRARKRPDSVEDVQSWADALLDLAEEQERLGEDARDTLTKGIVACDSVLALAAGDSRAHWMRGRLRGLLAEDAERRGRPAAEFRAAAWVDLTESLQRDPDFRNALFHRGLLSMHAAREPGADAAQAAVELGRALADFDRLLGRMPEDAQTALHRGLVHYYLGLGEIDLGRDPSQSFGKALADYGTALKSDSQAAAARTNRALLRAAQAKHRLKQGLSPVEEIAGALEDARQARELRPTLAKPHSVEGDALFARAVWEERQGIDMEGTLNQAVAAYQAAGRLGDGPAHLELGRVLTILGRFDEAIEAFTRGAQAVPAATTWARKQIADAEGRKKDEEERQRVSPWKSELARARERIVAEEYVAARESLRIGLESWEAQSAEEKRDRLERRAVRAILGEAHYYYASLLSMQALGQDDGRAKSREVPAEERERTLELAFSHLARSFELGWCDVERAKTEPAFVAWHEDARWRALMERWGK